MGTHIGSGPAIHVPVKTFALLDEITAALGTTKMSFWPFLGAGAASTTMTKMLPTYGTGASSSYLSTSQQSGATGVERALGHLHPGGIYSLQFVVGGDEHLRTDAGNSAHSFAGDTAFSVGGWFMIQEDIGTQTSLLAKYDDTGASEKREWDFRFDTSGQLELELYDEDTDSSEIATGGTALVPFVWNFVVATYDGTAATPDVHLYTNATDTNPSGATTEAGAGYTSMRADTAPVLVGARRLTATATQVHGGRIALPFICGKELSQVNVTTIYNTGKILLGLA